MLISISIPWALYLVCCHSSEAVRLTEAKSITSRTSNFKLPLSSRLQLGEEGTYSSSALGRYRGCLNFRGGSSEPLKPKDIEVISLKRALFTVASAFFVSMLFGCHLLFYGGRQQALEFWSSYLVAMVLSIDNIFVFVLLFEYFHVPPSSQSKVLLWGLSGAVSVRAAISTLGSTVLRKSRVIILAFAAILVISSWNYFTHVGDQSNIALSENFVVKKVRSLCPFAVDFFDGDKFFTMVDGVKRPTPLLLCLVCVEISDLVFAIDSVPAILSITQDPFVIVSSNAFAMVGLRSMYTIIAHWLTKIPLLRPAVASILGFIGLKMLLEFFHVIISTGFSLSVIAAVLIAALLFSGLSAAGIAHIFSSHLREVESGPGARLLASNAEPQQTQRRTERISIVNIATASFYEAHLGPENNLSNEETS